MTRFRTRRRLLRATIEKKQEAERPDRGEDQQSSTRASRPWIWRSTRARNLSVEKKRLDELEAKMQELRRTAREARLQHEAAFELQAKTAAGAGRARREPDPDREEAERAGQVDRDRGQRPREGRRRGRAHRREEGRSPTRSSATGSGSSRLKEALRGGRGQRLHRRAQPDDQLPIAIFAGVRER